MSAIVRAPPAREAGPGEWRRVGGLFGALLKSHWVTHRPFFLAHAVTFGCNSKCLTCSYWKLTPRMKEDMSTDEALDLIDRAYAAGMRGYYLFGGEPLIRKDVGQLLDHAKGRGFVTSINTNGALLSAKAASLGSLDFAFVSLDYHDSYNDYIRGRPRAFEEVVHGIARLREVTRTKVSLVTTISSLNRDAMEPMARLADRLGVSIAFNSIEPTMDFGLTDSDHSPNFHLALTPAELHEFYVRAWRLKREGYPLLETEEILRGYVEGRPWTCEFPKMFIYVSPDGKIYGCDYRYGYDLRHGSFEEYFSSDAFREYSQGAESCNRCVRTCVRSYSYIYELRPSHLVHLAQNAAGMYRHRPREEGGAATAPGKVSPRKGTGILSTLRGSFRDERGKPINR